MNNTLTALSGIKVGHSTHLDKLTGCTVVLFDKPCTVGYKAYGGSVGAFNTEGLKSEKTSYKEHGLFIAGGSISGLAAGSEILECLREDKVGHKTGITEAIYNPSVSGAIIFDQGMHLAPFDRAYGREAYKNATYEPVASGNVGAGTGASVGKFHWLLDGTRTGAMKAGVGNARVNLGNGITVCAMSIVNPSGNIIKRNGEILAGNREVHKKFKQYEDMVDFVTNDRSNTTISVVGVNVELGSKEHYSVLAHMASHGQVRAINPINTSSDGDSVFIFSTDEIKKPLNNMAEYFKETEDTRFFLIDIIGHAAAKAVQDSIYDAVNSAETIPFELGYKGIIPSAKDYNQQHHE